VVNRRTLMQSLASVGLVACTPKLTPKTRSALSLSASLMVDALCYDGELTPLAVERALAGGLTAAVFDIAAYPREVVQAREALAQWKQRFETANYRVNCVRSAADFTHGLKAKTLGIVLACQDASILGSSLGDWEEHLKDFYASGLRVLQLTHNARTHWGDSFFEKRDAGVSLAGEQLIAAMNTLGMLIDLSHCSAQTLLDAVQLSKRPCVVTHAGCHSLAPTKRNKTDALIRVLGNSGGFFGIFNMSTWLTSEPQVTINTLIDHIDHVVQLIGAQQVGFGSDGALSALNAEQERTRMARVQQMNAGGPSAEWTVHHTRVPELNAPDRLAVLAEALTARGFNDTDIRGICGGNFVRIFEKVCG
jgi:membrane dipeptidase